MNRSITKESSHYASFDTNNSLKYHENWATFPQVVSLSLKVTLCDGRGRTWIEALSGADDTIISKIHVTLLS